LVNQVGGGPQSGDRLDRYSLILHGCPHAPPRLSITRGSLITTSKVYIHKYASCTVTGPATQSLKSRAASRPQSSRGGEPARPNEPPPPQVFVSRLTGISSPLANPEPRYDRTRLTSTSAGGVGWAPPLACRLASVVSRCSCRATSAARWSASVANRRRYSDERWIDAGEAEYTPPGVAQGREVGVGGNAGGRWQVRRGGRAFARAKGTAASQGWQGQSRRCGRGWADRECWGPD